MIPISILLRIASSPPSITSFSLHPQFLQRYDPPFRGSKMAAAPRRRRKLKQQDPVYPFIGHCILQQEMKEGVVVVQLNNNSRDNLMIENVGIKGFDLEPELDFWPIQHPTEPSHEDRPVQCPMPHCSHLISDERMKDDRFSERKRPEAKTILYKEHNAVKAIEPPVRMVRKRHHDHTNTIIPLQQTPPVDPHLYQKDGCNHLQ